MEKITAVCTAIYLALIVSGCVNDQLPPVKVELIYSRQGYSEYNRLCFVGNNHFVEILNDPVLGVDNGIYIREIGEPSKIDHYIAPYKDETGKLQRIGGLATYNNRFFISGKGTNPSVFDPELEKIMELQENSVYLNDQVISGHIQLFRTPLNHYYYNIFYGKAGVNYFVGEKILLPEDLHLGYINPKKLHEYSAFEQLFSEFNENGYIDYTHQFGYNDKLKTLFFIHESKPAFLYAKMDVEGKWEGWEVAIENLKNREDLPSYLLSFDDKFWEVLSPEHFIGPYSPYPGSAAMSLDVLDTKGRVHETGCYIVDDYAVSPNGRHVIAYGGYKNEAGEDIGGLLVFEISYQASITVKGAVLKDRGSIEGKTLRLLRQGQKCTVLEHSEFKDYVDGVEDCWYKIRLPNKREGWVFGAQLDFD